MSHNVKAKSIACQGLAVVAALCSLTVGSNRAMAAGVALRCTMNGGATFHEWEVNETRVVEDGKRLAIATNIAVTARYISWVIDNASLHLRLDIKGDLAIRTVADACRGGIDVGLERDSAAVALSMNQHRRLLKTKPPRDGPEPSARRQWTKNQFVRL